MKRFIVAVAIMSVLTLLGLYIYFGTTFVIDLNPDAPIETWTRVEGKKIQVDAGDGWEDFEIRGVDMGVGIPGHFATDYAIDRDTYLRWFDLIKEMGANTIRVYILQGTSFYEAFYEYNLNNPDPLYLIQGVWIDDYVQNSHMDAYASEYYGEFIDDCRTVVDALHGRRWIELGTLAATGTYTKDVSDWVLGYIIGVEWEAPTVAYTDNSNELMGAYQGTYISSRSSAFSPLATGRRRIPLTIRVRFRSSLRNTRRWTLRTSLPRTPWSLACSPHITCIHIIPTICSTFQAMRAQRMTGERSTPISLTSRPLWSITRFLWSSLNTVSLRREEWPSETQIRDATRAT